MSHEVDTTDGQSPFVSAHTDAWHQLGTTLDHSFTAEEAMAEGLLGGWNVRKVPLLAEIGQRKRVKTTKGVSYSLGKETVAISGMNAVVRDNPVRKGQVDVLGKYGVSDTYKIIQNEEHAGLLNALVEESGAHFETAGSLYGGRQVFITMRLPGHINVGGVDPVDNYIAAINSHDGSMAFTLMVTPVRIVCANTLNMAFSNNSHQFRIRHTSGAEAAMHTQARQALDLTFNYLDGFQEEADRLINTVLTEAQFEDIIQRNFGAPDDAAAASVTRCDKKLDEMMGLFAEAQTQQGIRNTAWAGLNALTEWADHFAPTRGDDRDNSRAAKALLDPSFKNTALRLMKAAVS